jgi:cation:H+ antiporter
MVLLLLAAAFVLIIVGAIGFTNAVEWLGQKLNLASGATGALLAAVGTALPESAIPAVALVSGTGESSQIAIGSIIGAPFMLATVAMLMVAGSAVAFEQRRAQGRALELDLPTTRRDIAFFLACFTVVLALGLGVPFWVRVLGAVGLVVAYAVYAWRTVEETGDADAEEELDGLFFDPSRDDPPNAVQIGAQFVVSLAAIIGGAELFVHQVEHLAHALGIDTLVLALVLTPLATELPEKANSVLWVREGKDTLALGNITGAMVFQSTLPVSVGLLFTSWRLEPAALAAGATALAGGALALAAVSRRRLGWPPTVGWAVLFGAFVAFVALE